MDSIWIHSVVFGGWLLGGVIGGATGIGAVMIAMPILTAVLSPGDAVLVSCLIGLYGCTHLAVAYRRDCVWSDIRDLTIGVIPGCLVGVLALKVASVSALELMISAMLACFVFLRLFRKTAAYCLPASTPLGIAAGSVCGFVGASVVMVGAPLGIYALLRQWEPNRARGNMSVLYVFTGVGAVAMQGASGLYDGRLFLFALSGIAGCFLGQLVGVRLGRKIGRVLFNRLLVGFLAVSALILFIRAVS